MPAPGPAVLYDAECGFCRIAVAMLLRADTAGVLEPVAIQSERGGRLLATVPEADRLASAHCVPAAGQVLSGGAAFAPVSAALGRFRALTWAAGRFPSAAEMSYRLVARNRSRLSWIATPARLESADAVIAARAERFNGGQS